MKKTYYLYAGYYELHLAAHKLDAPFVFISKHRKIGRALEAAMRFDDDASLIPYSDCVDDVAKFTGSDAKEWIIGDKEEAA